MSRALFRSSLPELGSFSAARLRPTAAVLPFSWATRSFNSTAPIVEPVSSVSNNASNPTASQVRPLALKKSHPAAPPTPIADSGSPHIDERVFECRATVLGVESEPLRIKIKKKRRQRRKRQAKSKHRYTILRVSELNIKNLEEAAAE
ncbi:unnamed protein product [Clonostachys rosea f. rosea IK726]|uniref:Uncharacterized protein n=2 Tax=Bionectria ochroleuca TaxID=29856 RepID=A0A0B7JLG1_BIOOC|nr:unnamed protein product [Clonostachys rosea f. rosea IK726]